jgi:hypothetical protein
MAMGLFFCTISLSVLAFIVSTTEWTPSDIMAELLLTKPAINFVTAMRRFAASAL